MKLHDYEIEAMKAFALQVSCYINGERDRDDNEMRFSAIGFSPLPNYAVVVFEGGSDTIARIVRVKDEPALTFHEKIMMLDDAVAIEIIDGKSPFVVEYASEAFFLDTDKIDEVFDEVTRFEAEQLRIAAGRDVIAKDVALRALARSRALRLAA